MSRERADLDREGRLDGVTVEAWNAYLEAVVAGGRAENGAVPVLVGEFAAVDRRLRALDAVHRPPVGERERVWAGLMETRIVPAAMGRSIPGRIGLVAATGGGTNRGALEARGRWPIVPAFEIAAAVVLLIGFVGLIGALRGNEDSGEHPGAGATPAAIASPAAGVRPIQIRVESAGVDAQIEPDTDFELSFPFATGPFVVGWDERSAELGERGNVVLFGHIDYFTTPRAVFHDLYLVGPGDRIEVVGADGVTYAYVVEEVASFPAQGLPAADGESIVGPTEDERLTLVTEAGPFDSDLGMYTRFLVVRALRVADIESGTPAAATPVAEVACTAGPRSAESIAEIDGDPAVPDVLVAARVPGGLPQLANYRTGRDTAIEAPAPPETDAALAATLNELAACRALGGRDGVERVWALHSADFFRRYDSGSLSPPGRAWWGGPGDPATYEIDAVVRLPDGRVRVWLIFAREPNREVSEGVGAVFVEHDGRWLLDEIAFSGVPSDPAHWPPVPAPGECVVAPRQAESLVAIAGTPVAATFGPAAADDDGDELPYLRVPQGGADPVTNARLGTEEYAATLRDTARVLAACVNADDTARRYALYADDFVRRSRMIGRSEPDAGEFATAPAPLLANERVVAPALIDGIILPDGRIGFVALDWPSPPDERVAESEAAFVVFVQVGDRWLIDEVVLGRDAIVIGPEPLSSPTLILRHDLPSGFALSVIAAQQVTVRVENPTDADRRFALPAAGVSTVVPAGDFVVVSFYLPAGEYPVTVSGDAGEVTGTVVVRLSESIAVTPHLP